MISRTVVIRLILLRLNNKVAYAATYGQTRVTVKAWDMSELGRSAIASAARQTLTVSEIKTAAMNCLRLINIDNTSLAGVVSWEPKDRLLCWYFKKLRGLCEDKQFGSQRM